MGERIQGERIRAILIGAPAERAEVVAGELADLVDLTVEPTYFLGIHEARAASLVLVDLAGDPDTAFATLDRIHREAAELLLVAVGIDRDADRILQAMRAGATEYAVIEQGELRRLIAEMVRPREEEKIGASVVLLPAKGGVGSTTLAVNLAGCLEASGARTVVVDLKLALGDVQVFLDVGSRFTLSDVARHMAQLDRELLFASVARHPSGVDVLSQVDRIVEIDYLTPWRIGLLLDFLERHYQFVIVDGVNDFDEIGLAALDAARRILLLTTQEIPSLRSAQRCLDVLRRIGHEPKVELVVTRLDRHAPASVPLVVDTLGMAVSATIANDHEAVMSSIQHAGMLKDFAPHARVTADVRKLAEHLLRDRPALLASPPHRPSPHHLHAAR